jgi:DNA-binding GntR family transcriptional regulator
LPDEVAARLRERIMTATLRPGDHLPLDVLAEELRISVTPVREALLALRGEGFVELEPRRGFMVASLSRQDIEDIHQVWAMLAGELAARAARKITDDELGELDELQNTLVRLDRRDTEGVDELDFRFHRAIHRIAESDRITWFLGIAGQYAPRRLAATVTGWRDASVEDHPKILLALSDHNETAARQAMHAHISRTGRLLVRHLERSAFWADR